MIVFGDSLSDTGNVSGWLVELLGYEQHDGRFTSGPTTSPPSQYGEVWHEVLARSINITPATNSDGGGMNYAHGDAVTGDGTKNLGITDNVGKQVSGHLNLGRAPGPGALHVVFAGGNDLMDAAEALDDATDPSIDLDQVAREAVANLEGYIEDLVADDGARTVLWPNLPDLSRAPRAATFEHDSTRTALREASALFKEEWSVAIARLRKEEGVFLYGLDISAKFNDMLQNPGDYGFEDTTGTAFDDDSAPTADTYLFWDEMHPTSIAHKYLGEEAFAALRFTELDASARLTTGSPASILQEVSTAEEAFDLTFSYEFETTTGELTVSLGETVLARIPASEVLIGQSTVALEITDPSLLGELLALDFTLDGPAGSSILLDDIRMPGLLNGHFETGDLEAWSTVSSGAGAVGLSVDVVPEPATLSLLALGGLAMLRRRRR